MKNKQGNVRDQLWGDTGPYSQAQLITEVRILDDSVSRTFLIVSVNINPMTMKIVRKNPEQFEADPEASGIIHHAKYFGPKDGYCLYVFKTEYFDETVMQEAQAILDETTKAIINMHRYVIQYLNNSSSVFKS